MYHHSFIRTFSPLCLCVTNRTFTENSSFVSLYLSTFLFLLFCFVLLKQPVSDDSVVRSWTKMNFIFLLRRRRLALVTCFLCGINNKGNLFFKVKNCLITIIPIKKWSIFRTISLRKFFFFPLFARCALISSLYLTSAMFCSSRESQKSFSGKFFTKLPSNYIHYVQ